MIFSCLLLVAAANAQASCSKDVLIDDLAVISEARIDGELKQVNKLGGDYGSAGANFSIIPASRSMIITASRAPIGRPEPQANPGTVPTFNYWFTKFEPNACFDLSPYSAIQFDLIAPIGTDMNFTLTQKSPNCSVRLVDSKYQLLSRYIKPNGLKQTVILPFNDFSTNLLGRPFDFVHLKDWTIVNITPGNKYTISNLILKGGPVGCFLPNSTKEVKSTSISNVSSPLSTPTRRNSAVGTTCSAVTAISFALALMCF